MMSTQGPTLPPHLLAKRKHEDEDDKTTARPRNSRSPSSSPEADGAKKRRLAGPAPPPARLDERPTYPPDAESDSSSDDDDGYGPALPSTGSTARPAQSVFDNMPQERDTAKRESKRDEWMMMPPTQDDLSARMDPTKQRARGFNTGKGAKGASGPAGSNAMWTETPEQRRKRLEDEVMGVKRSDSQGLDVTKDLRKQREDEEKARKIKEHNEKHRGESLYKQHQGTSKAKEDDDPSKRAFDYDKDMSAGSKIGHSQKKELLNKASDFGSRFSSARYL
ncbi:hypothetical protein FH972_025812 [Carpinus fangiana]|uniref:DUF3752 domain-containing protein n=1 Tax=Carpinus fangiana TaxID=176857 RepID=A0A5N6L4P1_9ROSI|nr:hypothetical protein FH972_025812 [Carpinus fangiana]